MTSLKSFLFFGKFAKKLLESKDKSINMQLTKFEQNRSNRYDVIDVSHLHFLNLSKIALIFIYV